MFSSRRERFLAAGCAILLFIVLTTTPSSRLFERAWGKQSSSSDSDIFSQLKVFTDVLAIVQKDYVKEVKAKDLIEGAIKGMITSLDPHSSYLDPDFYQDLQIHTKGEFGGLGLEITVKDGMLVVVSPMEGSPAAKVGIKPNDVIVKIEGLFTKDFSLVDAVKKMRGPKGSSISLTLYRKSTQSTFDVNVVRDVIQVKSIRSRSLGDGFGYVRINQFVETSADDLFAAVRKIEKTTPDSDIKGLILDFRNNPGGLLTQAIRISDMFLKEGVIVYTDGRVESQKQKFFAHSRGTEKDYPLVVLINGGSASASEIVAGALKEHGRAIIVGTRSFGKGSVQTVTPLENGGALSLTTALYYLKNGESIQLTGVTPDVEVAEPAPLPVKAQQTVDVRAPLREGDLPGAIANPNQATGTVGTVPSHEDPMKKLNNTPTISTTTGTGGTSSDADTENLDPEKAPIELLMAKDPQLAKAFEVLRGF